MSGTQNSPTATCQCGYPLFPEQLCPECGREFHLATAVPPKRRSSLLPLLSIGLTIGTFGTFPCGCGYLQPEGLPFSLGAVVLAWSPFLFKWARHGRRRFTTLLAIFLASLLLAKNAADVLWYGHDPLLP